MKGIDQRIEDLIISHLLGDLDEKGEDELRQWIHASKENEDHFLEEQEIWFSSMDADISMQYNKDKAYEKFCARIHKGDGRDISEHGKHLWRYVSAAAAAVLLVIVSYASYHGGASKVKSEFGDIAIEVPEGARTKLNLPDGTTVWLNAGSKLSYSQGFGVSERSVCIQGEAYFDVAKNPRLPFSVRSGCICVKVLGTKFNYRDYPNDKDAVVSLDEGHVTLTTNKGKALYDLLPHQRAVYDKGTENMSVVSYSPFADCQWIEGVLVMNGEPMDEIVRKLERNYHVRITIADSALLKNHFYGEFLRQEQSLKDVLDALSATSKLHYLMNGRSVQLYR